MDPFNMPQWGAGQAPTPTQQLSTTISQVAPLAQNYNGAQVGQGSVPQVFNAPKAAPQQSNIAKLGSFVSDIFHETGNIVSGASKWLATNATAAVEAPIKFGNAEAHGIIDNLDLKSINAANQQNSDTLTTLSQQYKSGLITSKQYKLGLAQLTTDINETRNQENNVSNRAAADQGQTIKSGIDTASTLVTILTAGFGKATATAVNVGGETGLGLTPLAAKSAGEFLAGKATDNIFTPISNAISKLVGTPAAMDTLDVSAKTALQKATAEVVSQSAANMTAGQISRAVASNIALKYPIYFNALSTTGQELYQKLDDKKYGSAIRQMAFNAALLLSGGPIGQALKFGGKAIGGFTMKTFGQSSFIDELSKGIGDGSADGLFNAVTKLPEDQQAEVVKALSNVEATNMGAVGGKDVQAAAQRVLTGMASYEGLSMSSFTHDEALANMVSFSKAQQLADSVAKSAGLGPVTVGRVDARTLNMISSQLSPTASSDFKDITHNAWDALKVQNPNAAWANNENFDRQISALINKHDTPGELDLAISKIKASFKVDGFPETEARQLSKMGYIPIKPINLEAPFKEGAGQVATKFASGEGLFTHAVQPVPILKPIGDLLTNMGLSPTGSAVRVYQLFNQNLAKTFSETDIVKTVIGDNASEKADTMIKQLSNYAHNPTRGIHVNGRPLAPITDLRQLNTKDIMAALGVDREGAKDVKSAIMDSMLQVPLQVRGLGDKLVDINYKFNPVAAKYARIQGAARFAWNPFFQAKLAYKTELLSQVEAHGKFPTLAGTNTILSIVFPDTYTRIDETREVLRNAGALEKTPARFGEGFSGEAVNDTGVGSANLTHKLTQGQERSISSMVITQADRVGLSAKDFVDQFPRAVKDNIQMIAQYDRNSPFLNSAMARTLNIAFFPFRFEYKVGSIMAKNLAQTSTMTQLAVIKGIYNAHDWLNSTEGQVWYSQNSHVIGLFEYFTPIQTLASVAEALSAPKDAVGSFGELGGLPFGWIPQLLDAEGLTHFGQAYVSPTSGQELPDYVPTTDKGAAVAAIQDFIGSIFTYPGATVGLPSKTSIDTNIALGVTGASKKTDFTKTLQPLSTQQQDFSSTVQGLAGQTMSTGAQQNVQHFGPPTDNTQTTQVPAQSSPLTTPQQKPNSTSASTKKKKSQFTPALLPGQTQLGQL